MVICEQLQQEKPEQRLGSVKISLVTGEELAIVSHCSEKKDGTSGRVDPREPDGRPRTGVSRRDDLGTEASRPEGHVPGQSSVPVSTDTQMLGM
jgi:hypothetical protein